MVKLENHIFKKQVTFDHYIEKQRVAEFFQVIPLALFMVGRGYYLFDENIITLYHIPLQEPVKETKRSKKTLIEWCIVLIGFFTFYNYLCSGSYKKPKRKGPLCSKLSSKILEN